MLWESKKVRKDFLEEVVYQFWREERIGIDLTEGEMGEACYPQREDPLVERRATLLENWKVSICGVHGELEGELKKMLENVGLVGSKNMGRPW